MTEQEKTSKYIVGAVAQKREARRARNVEIYEQVRDALAAHSSPMDVYRAVAEEKRLSVSYIMRIYKEQSPNS